MSVPRAVALLRRHAWALAATAALAAALSGIVGLNAPRRYDVTTTTQVPSSGDARGAQRLVEDLQAVVDDPALGDAVAERAGVPDAAITGRVTVRQIGESSSIRWRLRVGGDRRDDAGRILLATVEEAHRAVMRPDVTEAERALGTATRALEDAQEALASFTQTTGFAGPDAYERLQSELTAVRIRAETARAEGDRTVAAALDRQVEALQALVGAVAEQKAEYDALTAQRARAEARVDRAQGALDAVRARLEALDSTPTRPTAPVVVTPTAMVVRRAVAAALAATAIAAVAIVVLDHRRATRAATRRTTRTEELRRAMGAV